MVVFVDPRAVKPVFLKKKRAMGKNLVFFANFFFHFGKRFLGFFKNFARGENFRGLAGSFGFFFLLGGGTRKKN